MEKKDGESTRRVKGNESGVKIPEGFIVRMEGQIGTTETKVLCEALEEMPVTGVRLNPGKQAPDLWPGMGRVEWSERGYRLPQRPEFTLDPAWHQGRYYVQEPSSMAVEQGAVRVDEWMSGRVRRVLDLCAAPGGKSIAVIDRLPEDVLLIANEYDRRRASILEENLTKWGRKNVIVTQGEVSRICSATEGSIDLLIADVPCSGEGMMRREPAARQQWSEGLVKSCAALQREILEEGIKALRPGGWMIYSTCTFNHEENEENVEWLCREHGMTCMEGLIEYEGHFFPHKVQGEGFFFSLLQKPSGEEPSRRKQKGCKGRKKLVEITDASQFSWYDAEGMILFSTEDAVWAIGNEHKELAEEILAKATVLSAGTKIATKGKRGWEPTHEVAMSQRLKRGCFEEMDLSRTDALRYLARRTDFEATVPEGGNALLLVTYQGVPLGWLKRIGNRCNNLYPMAWRIRKPLD